MKKKITAGVLLILLLAGVCIQPAYANSAQRHWRGTDGTGAVVTGEDCPIVVDKELLTFDVQEFPEQYYPDTDSFLAYTGNVTAEYIFRNPANYAVTATLVFPFGTPPDYGHIRNNGADGALHNHDTEKYGLSVNGEAIDCKIRHTLSPWGSQFDLDKDMIQAILAVALGISANEQTATQIEDSSYGKMLEKMIDDGDICAAEDLLFNDLDQSDLSWLQIALDFYSKLNNCSDDYLAMHDFSREEIDQGLRYICTLFGYDFFVSN